MAEFNIEWQCPHCKRETLIFCEYDSPSDYYPDTTCEHCNREINDNKLEMKIMEAVSNHYVSAAEYYCDR